MYYCIVVLLPINMEYVQDTLLCTESIKAFNGLDNDYQSFITEY